MLSQDKIISIFCFIDDLLKSIEHQDDGRRSVSDSEIVTTAIISALYFGGHQYHAMCFRKTHHYIPKMLEKSRFNRRLHHIGKLIWDLFEQVGSIFKNITCEMHYILDSFPVPLCDNIRIMRSKIVNGEQWRGYTASMKRYFYGVKVQLLTTGSGLPIAFHFTPGKQADVKALDKIIRNLPPEANVYGDSAYTDYQKEDNIFEQDLVYLKIQRKSNAKRKDNKQQTQEN